MASATSVRLGDPLPGQGTSAFSDQTDETMVLVSGRDTALSLREDTCKNATACDLSKHGRWTVTIDTPTTDSLCASDNICRGTFELEVIYICRYPFAMAFEDYLSILNSADIKEYDWPKKKEEHPSRTEIELSNFHYLRHKVTNDPEGVHVGIFLNDLESSLDKVDGLCPELYDAPFE